MRSVLAVLLAAVCFGTTGTAQALGPDADPLSIGAARLVVGGGALALIAGAQALAARRRARATAPVDRPCTRRRDAADAAGRALPRTRRRLPSWLLVAVGALGILAYQPAFFAGTAANGVAIGTVVALGSAPVLTGALDWLTRRRYPGHRWLVATAIATSGVAILAFAAGGGTGDGAGGGAGGGADASTGADPAGLAASVAAGLSYAVYTLAAKALIDRGWRSNTSMGALFGTSAIVALPILAATDASWLAEPGGAAMALWLGLVTTTLAYVLFGFGLVGLAPATVSTLTLAEPLTAGLLGVLLLGEQLAPAAWVGLAVLAAGIVVLATGSGSGPRRMSGAGTSVEEWTSSSSPASGSTPPRGTT
ncbi:EamA family transporter [Agromyces sp. MMS24-JH15]|uniref:EamA family transporter n=1 Tax=Agromyces sp. MMS24-JH15 TaxID=3243765 RepID=UPI00374805D2